MSYLLLPLLALALLFSPLFSCSRLNIHLVPHTHDDVGWLKTPTQYFLGANNSIQHAGVQYILDSVLLALEENPSRQFIYVEQYFFQTWLSGLSASRRQRVRALVSSGQLSFVNGGWSMTDEAAPLAVDMIDTFTLGHRYLLEEFSYIPRIGLFFGRIDYQDRQKRMKENTMEFVWRASESSGKNAQIFSGAFLSGNYGPPSGFCFDQFCSDPPIQDRRDLDGYNVDERVDAFVAAVVEMANFTEGPDLMLEMGSDFQYENANEWFTNMDKLIDAVNADGRVSAFYSNPLNYTRVKNSYNVSWSLKTDDFFPYADWSQAYWTGYFTSRPSLKRYVRTSSALLQAARHFEYFFQRPDATLTLWQALGVAQHHDAVAGTSKQHVAYDYAKQLAIGAAEASDFIMGAINALTDNKEEPIAFSDCPLMNVSICPATANPTQSLVFVVYNPLAHARADLLSVAVAFPDAGALSLIDGATGQSIAFDLVKNEPTAANKNESLPYTIHFIAPLPPMGYNTFFLVVAPAARPRHRPHRPMRPRPQAAPSISNDYWRLEFDPATGLLSQAVDLHSSVVHSFHQQFSFYISGMDSDQNSGAYIFRPEFKFAAPMAEEPAQLEFIEGAVVSEARQRVNDWVSQTIRLVRGSPLIEFDWTVGPVNVSDGNGREVITRYSTAIQSNATWFTDSNGRELQRRIRDYRPTWHWIPTQPIAGNYYPVNALAVIADKQNTMSVLVDRSEGVTSLTDGQLELMLHRRTLQDDSRGVGEPLNETDACTAYASSEGFTRLGRGLVIRGSHFVALTQTGHTSAIVRPAQHRLYQPPVVAIAPLTVSPAQYASEHSINASLGGELPANVELMTLQPLNTAGLVLIRLAHSAGVGEDAPFNGVVTVDLQGLFERGIVSVVEMTITNNQPKQQSKPLQWTIRPEDEARAPREFPRTPIGSSGSLVAIGPMEVKTFQVQLKQ